MLTAFLFDIRVVRKIKDRGHAGGTRSMRAMAFTLTLRVPQGDPTLNLYNQTNPNTYGYLVPQLNEALNSKGERCAARCVY